MRYLVLSDLHGSAYYANKIKEILEKEKPTKMILLGDLYYHGPRNPLTQEYNPMEVAKILNQFKQIICCVKGNCDAEVDEMISEFPFQDYIQETIHGKEFFFTHGHKYNIENLPEGIDVIVYGHYHTGFIKEKKEVLAVNPGSISLPKQETEHSYVIITDQEIQLKNIDGKQLNRKEYRK